MSPRASWVPWYRGARDPTRASPLAGGRNFPPPPSPPPRAAVGGGPEPARGCCRDELHGVEDLRIAGAAAEVAEKGVSDFLARGSRLFLEQHLRFHHDSRRAEATLGRTRGDEGLRPEAPLVGGEPLLSDDVLALDAGRLLGAGDDSVPVDDDRARPARALRRASVLHRPQAEVVAEDLEHAPPVAGIGGDRLTVERELHRHSIAPRTSARRDMRVTTPLNASIQYLACRVASTSSGSSSMRGRLCRTIESGLAWSRSSSRVTRYASGVVPTASPRSSRDFV